MTMPVSAKWRDGLLVALGVCLIVAPLLLDFLGDARAAWHSLLAGALLFTLGAAALKHQRGWEEWAVLVLGLWLIAAPMTLDFAASGAVGAHQVVGLLAAIGAAWNLATLWRGPPGPRHA